MVVGRPACQACYKRWRHAGYPPEGPPDPARRQSENAALGREVSMRRRQERADEVYILAAKGRSTAWMAEWFGVSQRTIQRDLASFEDV